MFTEIISFGSLSILFKGLKNEDKRYIATNYYKLHPKTLIHWLHFLTYVRNICAHHSRLLNKELDIRPRLDGLNNLWMPPFTPRNYRSFFVLLVLKYLLKHSGNGEQWTNSCDQLISPLLSKYNWAYESMGLPKKWRDHPLWKN